MKKLKLTKGLSFSMKDFSCKKGEPFCVDDKKAEKLLSTGRFEIFQNPQSDNLDNDEKMGKSDDSAELTTETIEKMKKDELIALAADKDIDIKDCNNNEERIERIKEALGLASYDLLRFEE